MKMLINYLVKGYNLLIKGGDLSQSLVLLFFRLGWGWEFFVSGRGKLKNHADIVDFFSSLHIPMPDLNAWFVGGLECVGGILLMLGLASRPIGMLLAINMTVAYLAVEEDRALVFNMLKSQEDFDKFVAADPFMFLVTALLVFAFGSGFISVDKLLQKTIFNRKPKALSASVTPDNHTPPSKEV